MTALTLLFAAIVGGWRVESSARVPDGGEVLSRPGYADQAWTPAVVPGTVVAALVATGRYGDPFAGTNLRAVPGGEVYPRAKNVSNIPTPPESPYRPSWWYRAEMDIPREQGRDHVWLRFSGINYRANVWMNGRKVAGADETVGAYRRFELDVTAMARPGARNAVAVEVFAPDHQDLAITWVDWNPMPPDRDMGLWGDVSVARSGPLALRHPNVITTLDLPSLETAHLTVTADVWNATDRAVAGTVRGTIGSIRFVQELRLGPRERKTVRFTPETTPALNIVHPRLWWPYRMGEPALHTLALEVDAGGTPSDRQEVRFGIQQTTSELTPEGHRLFKINGRPVLIRGGGWAGDMMLRHSRERLEHELRYVKEMGLNTVRLEGKLENDEFYEITDREGILVMPGWCCCDQWERWKDWTEENRRVAVLSLADQARRLRTHPSVFVWLNGSDNPPPAEVEKDYLDVLAKADWPRPILSSATEKGAASGPSGVKMRGPYDYVPPSYWLADKRNGGAFGLATEISPGAAVPPVESLRRMVGPDHLWPIDDVWLYHAGSQQFANLKMFTDALEARYGKAKDAEDYARKAQALAYDGERAMFEGYARNKYVSTGVIQWMLNNAWPSLIWHLYDWYLRPAGGYFGTKKACEPLHAQYSYDDRSVVVVNDRPVPRPGLKVAARVYDLGLASKFAQEAAVDLPADGVVRAFVVPEIADLSTTYFLKLTLTDATGRTVSDNFYWLSTRPDVLDWDKPLWYTTPTLEHADLTALEQLPRTSLGVTARPEGDRGARVVVQNKGNALAFQVRLKLLDMAGGEEEILPVFWEDNYIALLPGESREITVSLAWPPAGPAVVEADAWNAARVGAPLGTPPERR